MISQMCQDSLAASDSNKIDNFEETVYLIKKFVSICFSPKSILFIVLKKTYRSLCSKFCLSSLKTIIYVINAAANKNQIYKCFLFHILPFMTRAYKSKTIELGWKLTESPGTLLLFKKMRIIITLFSS